MVEDAAQRTRERADRPRRRRRNTSAHQKPGKTQFDHTYDQPDPRAYFGVLEEFDYETPGHAQGVFRRLVGARRDRKGQEDPVVLDLCCSYGVNAALLNHDLTLRALYQRYCSPELEPLSTEELTAADRMFFAGRRRSSSARVLGVDSAANAVSYARRAGLLAGGWDENLEVEGPSEDLRSNLARVDLVTVTGGIGYITEQTFTRVLGAVDDGHQPWVAAFALRWVDYTHIARLLAERGLVTEKLATRTFLQRRFTSAGERDYVLSELASLGIDPAGKEAEGCYHAELYISRPADEVDRQRLADLLDGVF